MKLIGRLVRQTLDDSDKKIDQLVQALATLKQALGLSNISQTAFVSARVLEGVNTLGMLKQYIPSVAFTTDLAA